MTLIAADSAPGETWCRSCCCWGTAIICAVLRAGLESHSAELWAHPSSQHHGGRDTSAPGDRRHRAHLEHWLWGEHSMPQSQPLLRPCSSLAPAPSRLQGPGGTHEPSCCPNPALAQPLPPPALQAGCTLPSSFLCFPCFLCLPVPGSTSRAVSHTPVSCRGRTATSAASASTAEEGESCLHTAWAAQVSSSGQQRVKGIRMVS